MNALNFILKSNSNLKYLNLKSCLHLNYLSLHHDELMEVIFTNGPLMKEFTIHCPSLDLLLCTGTPMSEEIRLGVRKGTNTRMRFIY
jgi:hypothetical protein